MILVNKIKTKVKSIHQAFYTKRLVSQFIKDLKKLEEKSIADKIEIRTNINTVIDAVKPHIDIWIQALEVVEKKYGKHKEASEVSTVFPFLYLSMIDILILQRQYLSTDDALEKNFICRTSAHHIYEFMRDGQKALGVQMNYLSGLKSERIDNELKSIRISFNELQNEFLNPFKELRHNVSGHKDRDIRSQLEISRNINTNNFEKSFALLMKFFTGLVLFQDSVHNEIFRETGIYK